MPIWFKMVIYYWKLQTPDKLIFNMIRVGNLLLETQDSRQTNFQYDQRGSRCRWHQRFNTMVRRRLFYALFTFHAWYWNRFLHSANTDIFRVIIAYCNSVIFFLVSCLNRSSSSHLAWKRQFWGGHSLSDVKRKESWESKL